MKNSDLLGCHLLAPSNLHCFKKRANSTTQQSSTVMALSVHTHIQTAWSEKEPTTELWLKKPETHRYLSPAALWGSAAWVTPPVAWKIFWKTYRKLPRYQKSFHIWICWGTEVIHYGRHSCFCTGTLLSSFLMITEIFIEIASWVTKQCCCEQDGALKMTVKFCRKLKRELLNQKQRIIF